MTETEATISLSMAIGISIGICTRECEREYEKWTRIWIWTCNFWTETGTIIEREWKTAI